MHALRRLVRPLGRLCDRHPLLSGTLLGVVIVGAWLRFIPADAPLPRIDILLFAAFGVLTILVAVVARAKGGDEDDDWSA